MNELIFNAKTGEIYKRFFNEPLTHFHLVLLKRPKSDCNQCLGRFYVGKTHNGIFGICPKCARKCLDKNKYLKNAPST